MTLLWETGRRDEARHELEALAADDFADIPRDGDWLIAITLLAEGAAELGDRERSRQLYELLLPYGAGNVVIGLAAVCLGAAARILGRLAATVGDRGEARPPLRARARGQHDARDPALPGPHAARLRRVPGRRGEASAKLVEAAARTAQELELPKRRAARRGALGHVAVHAGLAQGATLPALMAKTLVIAEKPSVGRDLARVLPGAFAKHEGYLEGPEHIVTWAVGHLVQLADPDEYDDRFKKWRMADLPIVPDRFKLVVRDERSKKQMNVVKRQLGRDDVDDVVNACDAGREGELIFAYLYEKAGSKKPVKRLWLNSMTTEAIKEAFERLRDGAELATLEAAARSRSEADWIVGMNATRAATIRLRSSFDGAVSLGRVQTPTLAILARREQEIRDFKPEPYWVVDAAVRPGRERRPRVYEGRYHAGANPRVKSAAEAEAIVRDCEGQIGEITKLEKSERKERAPLLYDLTSLQRDANSRFGFTARRTLAAAQRLYEEHKALTYPRTNSRFLTRDMIPEIKPIAGLVGEQREYARPPRVRARPRRAAARPRGQRREGHRPPRDHPDPRRAPSGRQDERGRPPDLRPGRAPLPGHLPSRRRVREHARRDDGGRAARVPHPRQADAGPRLARGLRRDPRRRARRRRRGARAAAARASSTASARAVTEIASEEKETKPPRRYTEGALLAAMETAGKLVDDEELREAMKDSGIGTPATRAAIIERLLQVGYIERDGRALVVTEKGMNVIRLLGEHALTSPGLTGEWEHRLARIETGEDSREAFMGDIVKFTEDTVGELDTKLKDVRIPRANLGPCPVCGRDIVENRKGYSCWSREDPGCGFVIWKAKAGKQLPLSRSPRS